VDKENEDLIYIYPSFPHDIYSMFYMCVNFSLFFFPTNKGKKLELGTDSEFKNN